MSNYSIRVYFRIFLLSRLKIVSTVISLMYCNLSNVRDEKNHVLNFESLWSSLYLGIFVSSRLKVVPTVRVNVISLLCVLKPLIVYKA